MHEENAGLVQVPSCWWVGREVCVQIFYTVMKLYLVDKTCWLSFLRQFWMHLKLSTLSLAISNNKSFRNVFSSQHMVAAHKVAFWKWSSHPSIVRQSFRQAIQGLNTRIKHDTRYLHTYSCCVVPWWMMNFMRQTQLWLTWLHKSEARWQCARVHNK